MSGRRCGPQRRVSLRIASRSASPPRFAVAGSSSVQEWRLPDGTVWAYGHEIEGELWLDLPGVGTFLSPTTRAASPRSRERSRRQRGP